MQKLPNGIRFKALTPSNSDLPLFLFFPGLDGSSLSIQNQLDGLKSKFEVHYLSIPAENRTPWNGLVKTVIALLQQDLKDFDPIAQKSRKIYLCGESFGACLALASVVYSPNFFDYLVLINPATSFRKQVWSPLSAFVVNKMPGTIYQLLTIGFLPFLTEKSRVSRENQQALLKAMQAFTPEGVAWRLSLLQQFQISPASLRCIRFPVLLIAALGDKLLPSVSEVEKISKWIPDSQVVQLAHGGHACLLERDVELFKIIENSSF